MKDSLLTAGNVCDDEEGSRESRDERESKKRVDLEFQRPRKAHSSQFKLLTLCFRDRDTNEASEASHKTPSATEEPLSMSHSCPVPSQGCIRLTSGVLLLEPHQCTRLGPDHWK